MASILFVISCVLLFKQKCVTTEYYTAVVDITKAWRLSQELVSDLNSYITLEEARLNRIRKVVKLLDTSGSTNVRSSTPYQQNNDLEEYLGNPINAYLTMKRLSSNWKSEISQLLDSVPNSYHNGKDNVSDYLNFTDAQNTTPMNTIRSRVKQHTDMLPGDSDVSGAVDAILRLQSTYRLPASRVAYGHLIDNLSSPQLSAAQCLEVGKQAYSQGDFERSEEWFRVAYDRLFDKLEEKLGFDTHGATMLSDETEETEPTVGQILDHLAYSLGRQGRYAEALNVTRLLIEEEPTNERAINNEAYYVEQLDRGEGRLGPNPRSQATSKHDQETELYESLCRDENPFPTVPSHYLTCRYYTPHAFYRIGPVKEETLYPDPRIVMWYDLIFPSEIEKIKDLATPRLRRATVKNPITGNLEVAFYRTSKSAWLPHSMDEVTYQISQRIRTVTGLSLETAEDLQVGNYGLGGHYAPHFDFGRKREKDAFEIQNGNRIATIIFYVSIIYWLAA
ncbi:Prolyl 4-hydroxylase subunit alpha-2 isoform 1 [Schistosoma japonicum]|uniref:Prolyl 4-hydroxylase subunit alpha-2 isoform 1 n=1 Tax=Schistosoma japonicum TaxID=6182 RepID=A0A4Z2CMX7_SCHJA|nr:Prolyl 4-hydroxylase subunit alpha-2 isoform 1 [Schistosoma japonicum]